MLQPIEEMRTIKLYGELGAKFGRKYVMAVKTPAEAVQALSSQLPGFAEYLYGAQERGRGFAVFVGKTNLAQDQLHFHAGSDDIRIAPVILGSKSGGIFQIVLGAALIVASFFIPAVGPILFNMGLAMVIGGVVQLLMPVPKINGVKERKPEDDPNYSFNGPVNTTAQGHPVPLLYGRMKVGSAVISAGITLKDEVEVPSSTPPDDGTIETGDIFWDGLLSVLEA